MPDMPTDFWSGWIAVVTLVSLSGLAWLVFSVYFSASNHHDDESPVWDETLREGSNPAPMWWFWTILAAMVFSVSYLMLYPGLGSYRGILQWSQGGRLEESMTGYRQTFAAPRAQIASAALDTLRNDAPVMDSARRVFDQHCSACHGPNGNGQAKHFPNLTDGDWQWGGDATSIEQSIRSGRQAAMVSWQAVLGDDGVAEVAQYVLDLSAENPLPPGSPGETQFRQFCSACHGFDGTGVVAVGGPNLTDDVSLYGATEADVVESIVAGRNGIMPAFDDRLDDVQIRMLVAWLTRDSSP